MFIKQIKNKPSSECCAAHDPPLSWISWLGQSSLTQSSQKSMGRLSTIDRMELIPSQDRKLGGNIRATLFVALNICLVFWNLLTKAAWQKPGSKSLLPKSCYFRCIRTPEINPKNPVRLLCSCCNLLQLSPSKSSGRAWTGRAAAALAGKAILC